MTHLIAYLDAKPKLAYLGVAAGLLVTGVIEAWPV